MDDKGRPYTHSVGKLSAGGTYDDLDGERVETGKLLVVTHISVENKTTVYTNLRIGIERTGVFAPHEEEKSPVAAEVYWTRSQILVPAGSKLRARLTGCTASDVLEMHVQGLIYQVEEE